MASKRAVIQLDGAHGEGGGALVRTALIMSAVTEQPFEIHNVRGSTRYPGLDSEDLVILQALAESVKAESIGAELGSDVLQFAPTRLPRALTTTLEPVRNAMGRGPNALVVLNSLLPVLTRSGAYSTVTVHGETHGTHSLSYDSFAALTLPALQRVGLYAFPTLHSAGFGRLSSGEVTLDIEPSHLDGLDWHDRGKLLTVRATVSSANVPESIVARASAHLKNLGRNIGIPLEVETLDLDAADPGLSVSIAAHYERGAGGGAALSQRGIRAEMVVQGAMDSFLEWERSDATVDPNLADQLLLPCVLGDGPTNLKISRLTQRLLTSIWVVKQFTPIHITVRGSEGSAGTIAIRHP